jgi:DNA-directed RNA polymerase subunit L
MELKIISKEKGAIDLAAVGMDEGLASLIAQKALDAKADFSAVSLDHPLTGNPVLHVHAANPKDALIDGAKDAEKELSEAQEALEKIRGK